MIHFYCGLFTTMGQFRVGGSCCSPLNDKTLPEIPGVFLEARGRKKKKKYIIVKNRQSVLHHPSNCSLCTWLPAFVTFGKLGTEFN